MFSVLLGFVRGTSSLADHAHLAAATSAMLTNHVVCHGRADRHRPEPDEVLSGVLLPTNMSSCSSRTPLASLSGST